MLLPHERETLDQGIRREWGIRGAFEATNDGRINRAFSPRPSPSGTRPCSLG